MENSDKLVQLAEQGNKLLRHLIIIQLAIAGVTQRDIRTIVGGGMNDINALIKLIRKGMKLPLNNPKSKTGGL